MLKSSCSASRFITTCAVLVIVACFGCCSTKSQLVGTWSTDTMGKSLGIPGSSPIATAETWEFLSNNTYRVRAFTRSGQGKYTVLDDGSIKIEAQGGATFTAKLENEKLIINYGKEQTILYKW